MKFELKTFNRNIPSRDLLDDLKKIAKELGKENITFREYNERGRYNSSTISERFGSWNNALDEAGLLVTQQKNISIEEFIDDLRKVSSELGKESITTREYNERGRYTSSTISEQSGSWNKALEEAALIVKHEHYISIDALFENIEQVWIKLGRQPTHRDMKFPLSKYTSSAYQSNFGTWRKALEKFVEFINSEEVETEQSIETKLVKTEQSIETISENTLCHKTKRNINLRLRFIVMRRDKFKCVACGRTQKEDLELQVDHIIAWSKGGETILENLQTLCFDCNIGKSDLDFKL